MFTMYEKLFRSTDVPIASISSPSICRASDPVLKFLMGQFHVITLLSMRYHALLVACSARWSTSFFFRPYHELRSIRTNYQPTLNLRQDRGDVSRGPEWSRVCSPAVQCWNLQVSRSAPPRPGKQCPSAWRGSGRRRRRSCCRRFACRGCPFVQAREFGASFCDGQGQGPGDVCNARGQAFFEQSRYQGEDAKDVHEH